MPVTCVIGGQFGSEGKGKVAYSIAKWRSAAVAVRVGGTNSGHTVVDEAGITHVFRQLPTAALLPNVHNILPAGSYLDVDLLERELFCYGVTAERLSIDPHAVIISQHERDEERRSSLREAIGSTESGTGAAVIARILRNGTARLAKDEPRLQAFIRKTRTVLRRYLDNGDRVVIEGTQGYGLSLLQADEYPYATSRDTSAAAFISEAGLSPTDVDEIVAVIRAFPIRVAGNSGALPLETNWDALTRQSGSRTPISERTTVTQRVRRVASFHPAIVQAMLESHPTALIAMNHLDYIDSDCANGVISPKVREFISRVETEIGRPLTWCGLSPSILIPMEANGELYRLRAG